MSSFLRAILSFLGSTLAGLGTLGAVIGGFFDLVSKVVQQSKIFITVLFLGFAYAFYLASETIIFWLLDDVLDIDGIFESGVINVSFLSHVCNFQPLLQLAVWVLSYWLTERAFFGSMLGLRIFQLIARNYGNCIKI